MCRRFRHALRASGKLEKRHANMTWLCLSHSKRAPTEHFVASFPKMIAYAPNSFVVLRTTYNTVRWSVRHYTSHHQSLLREIELNTLYRHVLGKEITSRQSLTHEYMSHNKHNSKKSVATFLNTLSPLQRDEIDTLKVPINRCSKQSIDQDHD